MSAFTTIARAFRGGLAPRPARGYILPLNSFSGDDALVDQQRSFQYFPASVEDSQATNYQTKVIPGLSHPLYQWTSGGARTISFEAIFTRDRTYTGTEKAGILRGQVSAGHSRTQNFSISSSNDPRNVDIPSAIAWLRSFLLPQYAKDSSAQGLQNETPSRPLPPQKMILGLPGTRLNWGVPELTPDQIYCIMTGCGVHYEGFFHDGTPRFAKVALQFSEIIQVQGTIKVHDGGVKRLVALGGYQLNDKGTKG